MDKSGGSKANCSTFADTTIVEITKSVDAQQISLTAVGNGGTCADEGKTLVTDNKAIVVAAGASRPDRALRLHSPRRKPPAYSASGDNRFLCGPRHSQVSRQCFDYKRQASYKQAKGKYDSAKKHDTIRHKNYDVIMITS